MAYVAGQDLGFGYGHDTRCGLDATVGLVVVETRQGRERNIHVSLQRDVLQSR